MRLQLTEKPNDYDGTSITYHLLHLLTIIPSRLTKLLCSAWQSNDKLQLLFHTSTFQYPDQPKPSTTRKDISLAAYWNIMLHPPKQSYLMNPTW
jgi:hypothetical protein